MLGSTAEDFKREIDVGAGRRISRIGGLLIRLPNGAKDIRRLDDTGAIVAFGEGAMRGGCTIGLLKVNDGRIATERSQPCVEIAVGRVGKEIRPCVY